MRNVNCQASHFISIMLLILVRREGEEREMREGEQERSEGLMGERTGREGGREGERERERERCSI